MLTKTIEHLEAEEVEGGCKVTIFYHHYYLKSPETLTAELFIDKNKHVGGDGNITDAFREIEVILGLDVPELNVDWRMMKDAPDDHPASTLPDGHPMKTIAVFNAPGRVFWKAEGYRP